MPPRIAKPIAARPAKPESVLNKENTKITKTKTEAKRTMIPDDIEEQDIDAKLNRLTDLLKMAKGSV
jgi:hypothetical protein